jgi:alpha-tubulin suppressor-like RCC1 family protein
MENSELDKSDLTSIRDIKIAETYSLALTEDGDVFSWGSGLNGHLGHGD